ncbi:Bcr/CflA family drug resistance efflux transporter, partial [Acinetobacter nematophilus]
SIGAAILNFFHWQAGFVALFIIGLICLACVHFLFKETLAPSRILQLNFSQVFILYAAIFKDRSFRFPMMAGCFTVAALFCYISSAAAVL